MNDLINKHNDLFQYLHPKLRENFINLCANGRVGLLPVSINNINIMNTKLVDMKYGYNFKIHIPYAGKTLIWEILFNPDDFEFAPDFDFNDDSFPQVVSIDEIEDKVPTLVDWNIENSGSLESCLQEWLKLYKEYQVRELNSSNTYSRLCIEYQFLVSNGETSHEDVEVLVDNNSIHFLISVRVHIGEIPHYMQEAADDGSLLNPKHDFALLFMVFQKSDASRVNVQVQLSPRLEQLIGRSKTLHIPNYKKDEASLAEYVPLVKALLQEQIDKVVFNFQYRKQFVTCLVALRRQSIIEYDSVSFHKLSMMCEVDNFLVVVQITLGDEFPKERPSVKLCSLYCVNPRTKIPCEMTLNSYKHMSSVPPDESSKHLLDHLSKSISDFEHHPHTSSSGKYHS